MDAIWWVVILFTVFIGAGGVLASYYWFEVRRPAAEGQDHDGTQPSAGSDPERR